jgi:hypothetical protein
LLTAVTVTGTVKTAPWQELSDALLIDTELGTVNVVVAPASTSRASPVWLAKVTPVEASHGAPLSEVIVPLPDTAVIRTGDEFPFVTRSFSGAVAPGYSAALVKAVASRKQPPPHRLASSYPDPLPLTLQAAIPGGSPFVSGQQPLSAFADKWFNPWNC